MFEFAAGTRKMVFCYRPLCGTAFDDAYAVKSGNALFGYYLIQPSGFFLPSSIETAYRDHDVKNKHAVIS
jgi:hypothetical protein